MKRAEFLKRLGLGAVAAVAAPALLAKEEPVSEWKSELSGSGENVFESKSDKCDKLDAYFITEDDRMIGPYKTPTWKSLRELNHSDKIECDGLIYKINNKPNH